MSENKSDTNEDQMQDLSSSLEQSSIAATTGPDSSSGLQTSSSITSLTEGQDSTFDHQPSGPSADSDQQATGPPPGLDHYTLEILGRVMRSEFTIHPETRDAGSAQGLLSYAVELHTLAMKSSPDPFALLSLMPIRLELNSLYGHEDEPGAKEAILKHIKYLDPSSR